MKRVFLASGLLAATLTLSGCGGSGENWRAIDNWVDDATYAVETMSYNRISALIDFNYLNNCFTKADVMDSYWDIFNNPDIEAIEVITYDVNQRYINDLDGLASFYWDSDWRVFYTDGSSETLNASGAVYLIRRGGTWREWGNQLCTAKVDKGWPLRVKKSDHFKPSSTPPPAVD